MVNNPIKLEANVWTVIADNVDYLLQNRTAEQVMIKASDTLPTNTSGSFVLENGELIGSTLLSGIVYAMSVKECYVTVAK